MCISILIIIIYIFFWSVLFGQKKSPKAATNEPKEKPEAVISTQVIFLISFKINILYILSVYKWNINITIYCMNTISSFKLYS